MDGGKLVPLSIVTISVEEAMLTPPTLSQGIFSFLLTVSFYHSTHLSEFSVVLSLHGVGQIHFLFTNYLITLHNYCLSVISLVQKLDIFSFQTLFFLFFFIFIHFEIDHTICLLNEISLY